MRKYQYPDGVIEVGFSVCCCPPGQRHKGMHTNAFTTWYRLNDGEWRRLEYSSYNREVLAIAETAQEAIKNFN